MKNAARKKLQQIGLGAAAAAALLTATGCGYVSSQATAEEYAPADGIQQDLGDVKVRDLLIVAKDENSQGRVLGGVVNEGDKDAVVTIKGNDETVEVKVPAGGERNLEKGEPVMLEKVGVRPGLMVDATLSADGQQAESDIPVLDHTFPRYREFVPGGAPSTPANPSNTAKPEGESGH